MPNKTTDDRRQNPYEGRQARYGDSTVADDLPPQEDPKPSFERGTVRPLGRNGKR